jgi:hypothetical protein
VIPKGLVNKQKTRPPSTKGPVKATLELKGQPGGFHLDNPQYFSTMDDNNVKGIMKKRNTDIEEAPFTSDAKTME